MQHSLNYGSVVLHQIIEANKRAGQTITELIGNDATPENTLEKLRTMQPIVFALVGHGNSDVTSVECTAVLVRSDSPELELFKDKIVSLTSCLTAQILGPAIIDAGAEAYTGYKEEFWFFIGDEAGTTPAVRSPFVAEFQFVASLLQGKSVSDARKDQLTKYDEEIAYWTSGAGKNDVNSMELSRILEMNKSNSVFLGVGTVTPSPTVSVSQATMGNPIVYAITLPLMALIIYRELKT
jgi:hypothetical protein